MVRMAGYITVCSQAVWQQRGFQTKISWKENDISWCSYFLVGISFLQQKKALKVKLALFVAFFFFGKWPKGGNRWPLSASFFSAAPSRFEFSP